MASISAPAPGGSLGLGHVPGDRVVHIAGIDRAPRQLNHLGHSGLPGFGQDPRHIGVPGQHEHSGDGLQGGTEAGRVVQVAGHGLHPGRKVGPTVAAGQRF
jgi:hypothetical protein